MTRQGTEFFDSMSDDTEFARPTKPIWSIGVDNKENQKKVLDWLRGEKIFLTTEVDDRLRQVRRNVALYRGIQFESQETRRDIRDRTADRSRSVKKIVVNNLYDLTQNRVSRIIKFKPAVAILPTNNEFEDEASASATKALLDHIWYTKKFEGKLTPEIARNSQIMGESYLWITWDPRLGDLHPDSPKDGEKVPLLDSNGKPQKDETGKPVVIKEPLKVGDVKYEVVLSSDIFMQKKTQFDDVDYVFRRKIMSVEALRLKYPDKAEEITSDDLDQVYDFENMELNGLINEVAVWEFWHKKTPEMPQGRFIEFTNEVILTNIEHPFSHGEFPFERFTDIDLPGQTYGVSFFETVKQLTATYNNVINMILRNEYLTSHPKWMVPAGSTSLTSLGNDITIVQYKGGVPPQLVQSNPTSPELFKMLDLVKQDFQQISGVFDISRGQTPAGVKSGIALQFLAEQESERFNEQILKWNQFIKGVAIKTLAVAGDYYDVTDGRMIRLLGKNDKWKTVFFDSDNLSKPYDIRVQNSSSLPQSKAARIQTIIDLNKEFPTMFTNEQVIDMVEFGQSDKYIDMATAAVKSAEAENQMIIHESGESMPAEYEDHIMHWNIHMRAVQEYSFKEQTPVKQQQTLKDHILVHESMMVEQAKKNPAMLQALAEIKMFPVFFQSAPAEAEAAEEELENQPKPDVNIDVQAGAFPPEQQVPVEGLEQQQEVNVPQPPIEPTGDVAIPEPGPIEPTSSV
ncbi:hypothetical protein GOV11_04205 [Candidatus Woesearchaeota archaeon]|nr:hypothetical protein [Candidatus Woesearchaeota archaeon]